jgi:dopamine beta-monooxygenase
LIQLHWNNPEKKANEIDSSGMIFYVTPKLRPYNSGMMMIGQTYLEIPPKQERYSVLGGCPAECSALIITNNITVVSAVNHMHYLGNFYTTIWKR